MRKMKILTVDDDPDILDVLDLSLSDHYQVFQAKDGKTGLELVLQKMPDLVICDYMMPVVNGRELCKTLKKDILLRHIPVIMLTGKGEVQDRISGIEAGADDYMIKPFDASIQRKYSPSGTPTWTSSRPIMTNTVLKKVTRLSKNSRGY